MMNHNDAKELFEMNTQNLVYDTNKFRHPIDLVAYLIQYNKHWQTDVDTATDSKETQQEQSDVKHDPRDIPLPPTNSKTFAECRCGGYVHMTTRQMRSADEGGHVFYNCTQCGRKWNERQ